MSTNALIKKLAAGLVLLFLLTTPLAARADEVLIYKGDTTVATSGSNESFETGSHAYILFDDAVGVQGTVDFNYITYGSSKAKGRFYHVYTATPYEVGHVTISKHATEVIFSNTATSGTSSYNFGYTLSTMSGAANVKLESGIIGNYSVPGTLRYALSSVIGDPSTASFETEGTGVFVLDIPLTKLSVFAGDSLAQAVTRVTDVLAGKGYTAQ